VPGVLLIFYPSAYSIQGDIDARILETLFGIPDYRYKVWLSRSVTHYIVIGVFLLLLAFLCRIALADFSIGEMLFISGCGTIDDVRVIKIAAAGEVFLDDP
jgi:hypothetical protein